jgi:glycosyltransferase involved in cell wall biosynthesis
MILPRISIVTPSFNQGQFLEECMDSILSQNYPNLEYIVMDGGSTDNSVEIIKKYAKHLTYWQSRPDGGQYDAINEGFKKTSGEIMAWLNSDDRYHNAALFKVASIFSKHREIEWLMGRPTIFDADGNFTLIYDYLPTFSREKYLNKDYKNPFLQQESTFWRRSLWEKAGAMLRTDLDLAGDIELWVRFFRHAQLFTVDTLLGGYRLYGNQKAALFMDEYIREADEVLDDEIALFTKGEFTKKLPMADPVAFSHVEMKSDIAAIYEANPGPSIKLSYDLDFAVSYFLNKLAALREELRESEADRAARLDSIHTLQAQLQEAEADRTARLDSIHTLQAQLQEAEADRAARLDYIHTLQAQLQEAEADRAARLDVIGTQSVKLAELEANRTELRSEVAVLRKFYYWTPLAPLRWLFEWLVRRK